MNLLRNIRHGLRNLWLFRREIWAWRGWDYRYDYDLFVRGLELTADHISECRNHVGWEQDVREIRHAVDTWRFFTDGVWGVHDGPMTARVAREITTLEQAAWRQFHAWCEDRAQGWWD